MFRGHGILWITEKGSAGGIRRFRIGDGPAISVDCLFPLGSEGVLLMLRFIGSPHANR